MGRPVVSVASGGMAVVETPRGTPVTEAANGFGMPVTKVVGKAGMPVVYETIGVAAPVTYAVLDGTPTNVTLSNGNLTATHSSATNNSGARSTTFKSSGKYYFEVTVGATHGQNDAIGIVSSGTAYVNLANGQGGPVLALTTGTIWGNNLNSGSTLGAVVAGNVVCFAINSDTGLFWVRKNNGNWNASAPANPATGVGGIVGGAVGTPGAPIIGFSGTGTLAGDNMTANFGVSAFTGAAPSGFTSGWPS